MPTPYLAEWVRRMRLDSPAVTVDVHDDLATIVWQPDNVDHPVTLLVREEDLATAVTAAGEDSRDALWPHSTIDAAGFNLLLVHLWEVLCTRDTSEPLRITEQGVQWPETRRRS